MSMNAQRYKTKQVLAIKVEENTLWQNYLRATFAKPMICLFIILFLLFVLIYPDEIVLPESSKYKMHADETDRDAVRKRERV